MYVIYTKDETYDKLTEQEFVTIKSMLNYNRVPYQWAYNI